MDYDDGDGLAPTEEPVGRRTGFTSGTHIGGEKRSGHPASQFREKVKYLKETYGKEYDIEERTANTAADVENALVDGDAVILFGHAGVPADGGGTYLAVDNSEVTIEMLKRVKQRRVKLGKDRLDFIEVYSCEVMMRGNMLAAWLNLTASLFGYEGTCVFGNDDKAWRGGKWWFHPGGKQWYYPKYHWGGRRAMEAGSGASG